MSDREVEATVVREIEMRFRGKRRPVQAKLSSPGAAAEFLRGLIDGDVREKFIAVYLDVRNRPIAWRLVSVGTATEALIHPRETYQAAVHLGAAGVIVAHNHPSGGSTPSREDIAVTERLARAGGILGIKLVDHIVLGATDFISLRAHIPGTFDAEPHPQYC